MQRLKVGKELPCYVHDRERDTALQCLMSDEAKPSCDAKHPSTSRLCVCVGEKRSESEMKSGVGSNRASHSDCWEVRGWLTLSAVLYNVQ